MFFDTSSISISSPPEDVLRRVESHIATHHGPDQIEGLEFAKIHWRIDDNRFTLRCVRFGDPTVLATVVVVPFKSGSKVDAEVGLSFSDSFFHLGVVLFLVTFWGGCSFLNLVAEYSQSMQHIQNGIAIFFLAFVALSYWETCRRAKPIAQLVYDYVVRFLAEPSTDLESNGEQPSVQS